MNRKIGILLGMFLLCVGIATAKTSVDAYWSGSGSVDVDFSNDYSNANLWGNAESMSGEFHADDDNYERVEVTSATGDYFNGEYNLYQFNDLQSGESEIGFRTAGDSVGFMNFRTDEWRTGNQLGTNGYNGYPWSWSGTEEPAIGASGNYFVGMYASTDSDSDGTSDSSYDVSVVGNGNYGFGTWKAGSNSILSAGRTKVSGEVLGYGSGSGSITQNFKNTGSFKTEFNWN
ncbi:MAG: hypothetical protein ACOC5T_07020 [Elusimicrobiota bacterium]